MAGRFLTRPFSRLCMLSKQVGLKNVSCHKPPSHESFVGHACNLSRAFSAGCAQFSPRVQEPAPDFCGTAVIQGQFREIKLSDFKGKYLILLFYPMDFTFVCPTEILSFNGRIEKFRELNTEVLGVSTDSHFSHFAWINLERKDGGLNGLKYPLMSDFNKKMARDYGVLIEEDGVAIRGLFIIDPKGIVRQITINDLPVGRSVDETYRLIQALQYVEKTGEVCPADWTPSAESIKPTPDEAKEYFEKVN